MADPMSQLRGYIHQTISTDRAQRLQAEQFLASVEHQPGFPVLIMDLIAQSAQSQAAEEVAITQAASVFFKNTVKRCWEPEEAHNRYFSRSLFACSIQELS
jgi:exportin-2 (importin alpha re-exporter)